MTNDRTIEGQAKVCDQREHRATLRLKGRLRDVLANSAFFVRPVENSILSRQIVIRQIALRQIALWQITTHPLKFFKNDLQSVKKIGVRHTLCPLHTPLKTHV